MSTEHKKLISMGEAATASIKSGGCDTALEWLEQGHYVVWG
jgi:hypothetical protein